MIIALIKGYYIPISLKYICHWSCPSVDYLLIRKREQTTFTSITFHSITKNF